MLMDGLAGRGECLGLFGFVEGWEGVWVYDDYRDSMSDWLLGVMDC